MSWITDVVRAGFIPRQHHDVQTARHQRQVMYGVRLNASGDDGVPEIAKGSVGAESGWFLAKSQTDGVPSVWSQALSVVSFGSSGTAGVGQTTTTRGKGGVSFLPDLGEFTPDHAFEPIHELGVPAWVSRPPDGWSGIMSSGTHPDRQSQCWHPDFLAVVASSRGDPGYSTNVVDTYGTMVDPRHYAPMHTAMRVETIAAKQNAPRADLISVGHVVTSPIGPGRGGMLWSTGSMVVSGWGGNGVGAGPFTFAPPSYAIGQTADSGPVVPMAISTGALFSSGAIGVGNTGCGPIDFSGDPGVHGYSVDNRCVIRFTGDSGVAGGAWAIYAPATTFIDAPPRPVTGSGQTQTRPVTGSSTTRPVTGSSRVAPTTGSAYSGGAGGGGIGGGAYSPAYPPPPGDANAAGGNRDGQIGGVVMVGPDGQVHRVDRDARGRINVFGQPGLNITNPNGGDAVGPVFTIGSQQPGGLFQINPYLGSGTNAAGNRVNVFGTGSALGIFGIGNRGDALFEILDPDGKRRRTGFGIGGGVPGAGGGFDVAPPREQDQRRRGNGGAGNPGPGRDPGSNGPRPGEPPRGYPPPGAPAGGGGPLGPQPGWPPQDWFRPSPPKYDPAKDPTRDEFPDIGDLDLNFGETTISDEENWDSTPEYDKIGDPAGRPLAYHQPNLIWNHGGMGFTVRATEKGQVDLTGKAGLLSADEKEALIETGRTAKLVGWGESEDGSWHGSVPADGFRAPPGTPTWTSGGITLLPACVDEEEYLRGEVNTADVEQTATLTIPTGLSTLTFGYPNQRTGLVESGTRMEATSSGVQTTYLDSDGADTPVNVLVGEGGHVFAGGVQVDTFHCTGKLTADGLIDPTGMEFTKQSSTPIGGSNYGIWVRTSDSALCYDAAGTTTVIGAAGGGGLELLANKSVEATTTSATLTTLQSYSLAAGKLATDGDMLRIRAVFRSTDTSFKTSVSRILFGSTAIATATFAHSASTNVILMVDVVRTGATTQIGTAEIIYTPTSTDHTSVGAHYTFRSAPAETLSGAITIAAQSSIAAGASGDGVHCQSLVVEYIPQL